MIVKHRLTMDLDQWSEVKYIDVMQDDKYSRDLEIAMKANMKEFCPPEGCTVLIRCRKGDGFFCAYDTMPNGEKAWSIAGNVLTVRLAPQVCAVAGQVHLIVSLQYGEAELSFFEICIQVHPRPEGVANSGKYVNVSGFVPQPENAAVGQYLKVTAVNDRGQITGVTTSEEVAVDGKSAYAYAQEGGYAGTEAEFAGKLAEEAPKAFYVTLITSTMTVDKTYEEIDAAYAAGKSIFCVFPSMVGTTVVNTLCPLAMKLPHNSGWVFSMVGWVAGQSNATAGYIVVLADGSVNADTVSLANAGDVPTKISQLINDRGYITAGEIPDSLPEVTAANNGAFLRVVNGAWAAATVTDAEEVAF